MKILTFVLLALMVFSCKKQRSCECEYIYTYSNTQIESPVGKKIESLGSVSKRDASKKCFDSESYGNGSLSNGSVYTYTLNTNCTIY